MVQATNFVEEVNRCSDHVRPTGQVKISAFFETVKLSKFYARILERLQALGYSEYEFPEGDVVWDKLMNQPKPLTDRSTFTILARWSCFDASQAWNNIRPKLEEQLAIERERRLQKEFEERADARLDVLAKWYEEDLFQNLTDPEIDLMPNRCDARELPTLRDFALADDARDRLSRRDFRMFAEDMLSEADAYKARAQRELAEVLLSDRWCADLEDVPVVDVLKRPFAYFACVRGCDVVVDGCAFFTYEQLHAHWRVVHPDAPWLYEEEISEWVKVPMLWPLSLPGIAHFALEAVGIAFDTPWEALDGWVKEGRLFCDCAHPGIPPPNEMSWVKLVSARVSKYLSYNR